MAVYKQNYKSYQGPLTPARWRFLILPRYSFRAVFDSRLFVMFFVICFIAPVGAALIIYFKHNINALRAVKVPLDRMAPINEWFFLGLFNIQNLFSFLLTALVGPGLISPDLANNALPLYLCRPFSRAEYVLGKLSVLVTLLSLITWIPGLALFGLQWSLEGNGWFSENLHIAGAIFLGSWIWILTISLLALALSAWVKWKPVAGALLFGVFFGAAAFGQAINNILYTQWGNLINLGMVMHTVSVWLFLGTSTNRSVPVWSAWLALAIACGFCVMLLARKIRACEVVR
ncbi:MAG TPA: hypothetical protein VGQ81_06140 [Acidobacteriota bacterium]|jgi:ABC-2 type transport system permease protein|nr:hypothetical protein [Acidobacteriota bacterium]